jgi:polyhydroxybutyrate depolymerase
VRILGLSARVMPRKQQVGLAVVVATVLVLAHGACAQDEGVLSGCYSQPTARAGIQTVNCDAADTVSGHTIGYTLSVPAACVSGSCGVVLDIHGYTMSASAEEQQDEMRHKASARGMIVVQPSAPRGPHRQDTRESAPSWQPLYHHHQIILFLRHIVDLFQVDRRAVHVTGYSQGGFATWNILCLAPDLICSAAPLAASGLDQWGPGYGNQCFNDNGPSIPRAVLYTTGETDTSAPYSNAQRQVANLQRIYGWHDTSPTVVQGREYTQSTWTTDDMTFTFIDHNYDIYNWMGHCFPTIGRRCCAGIDRCFRCCEAEFTWSDVVLDFFASNPCDGGGQGSETLAESFRGVKTVLCAVGASPGMNATLQQAVEFTGVENQIAALTAGNPGVEPTELTFVLCSSMGTTDPTPKPYEGGPILFWKLNAEAFLGSCGVTAVVVKPGGLLDGPQGKSTLVVGHDDKLLASVSPPTVTRADVAAVMVAAAAERSNLRFGLVSKPGPPGDMHALLQSARWPWDRRGQQHEL